MVGDGTNLAEALGLSVGPEADRGLFSQEDEQYLRQFQRNPTWNRIQDVLIGVFQANALTDIAKYADNATKVVAAAGGLAMVQRLLREMPMRMLEYKKAKQRVPVSPQHAPDATSSGPGLYEPSDT